MVEQRLSKLQRIIIETVSKKENNCYCNDLDMLRHEVRKTILGEMSRYINGLTEKQKNSFSVCFANSIRNLKKKGLVSFEWKSNSSRKSRIDKIYLTDKCLKLITIINNKRLLK